MFNRLVCAGLAAAALTVAPIAASGASADPSGQGHSAHVCATPAHAFAACDAVIRTDINHSSTVNPSGYHPADLQSAYALATAAASNGGGQTVAIVDAYDDPYAASDLNVYRSQFGIPVCNTSNPCFKKVNQNGQSSPLPRANGSWSQEISLDLDMVSAICPNCHILLVEASSASFNNLGTAENTAARLGASEISNSYGGGDAPDSTYGGYYNHAGVAVVASSGDSGYGTEYPASSAYVTAAGGTTLNTTSSGWSETAWSGAGSGCSSYNPTPSWQTVSTTCSKRAEADVSAVADPNTGVSVYDSYSSGGFRGWLVFGGTSVASPIIASVYALAGGEPAGQTGAVLPYNHASSLNDVTIGSNGSCGTKVCNAGSGWDGPTGLGTPNGIGAF